MNEIDKRIEKIEKGTPVYDCQGIIVCYTENDADKAWLIDQLKKCREEKAAIHYEWSKLQAMNDTLSVLSDADQKQIEQRTKETCFKAGWAWIQDDFGEQFGYDPTDDTDKEDFKQVIEKAKVE